MIHQPKNVFISGYEQHPRKIEQAAHFNSSRASLKPPQSATSILTRPQTSSAVAAGCMSKTHGNLQWARFTQEYNKASALGLKFNHQSQLAKTPLRPDGSVVIGEYPTIATSGNNLDHTKQSYSPDNNSMRQTKMFTFSQGSSNFKKVMGAPFTGLALGKHSYNLNELQNSPYVVAKQAATSSSGFHSSGAGKVRLISK